jgi:hypothetical protein
VPPASRRMKSLQLRTWSTPRPAMGVHRHDVPGGDPRLQHSHAFVLKEERVMTWRRVQGVQRRGPRPRGGARVSEISGHHILQRRAATTHRTSIGGRETQSPAAEAARLPHAGGMRCPINRNDRRTIAGALHFKLEIRLPQPPTIAARRRGSPGAADPKPSKSQRVGRAVGSGPSTWPEHRRDNSHSG